MKLNPTAPLCALLMTAFLLTACSEEQEATETVAAPIEQNAVKNLLLICIDTVRTDVFTALNASPSDPLNKWLEDALVYSRAKSSSSWTVPAVGTVFSGLWQYGHGAGQLPSMKIVDGVSTNESMHRPTAVYEGVPLLAEATKEAGFHTSIISASPWTNDTESRVGLNKGFDENLRIGKNGAKIAYKKMNEALATREEDQRFFQFMHFMEAHDWHIEPEEKMKERIAAFTPEQRDFYLRTAPPTACAEEESMLCTRYLNYAAAVVRLRESIARLLSSMQRDGLLEDTAVVVFSDHGERFGEHEDDPRIARSIKGLPDWFIGHGHSMYQELVHVPLFLWHPNLAGAEVNELVSLIDITPTVSRWLGLDFIPEDAPGIDLEAFLNPTEETRNRVAYASGIVRGEQQVSVSQGEMKSIWYMVSDDYSYYNVVEDPFETTSLADDRFVLKFDGYYVEYMESKRDVELLPAQFTKEQIQRLQAIGYLQGVESEDEADEAELQENFRE